MNDFSPDNPFNPGFGDNPAFFAGRQYEEKRITQNLLLMSKARNEDGEVIIETKAPFAIVGPRGVGKTILIKRILNKSKDMSISGFYITKADTKDEFRKLIGRLIENNSNFLQNFFSKYKLTYTKLGDLEVGFIKENEIFVDVLAEILKTKPVLLVIDEAHEIEDEIFASFANVIQSMKIESYPIGVIIAGTPILLTKLSGIKASFFGRTTKLKINTLKRAETVEAITKPFSNRNVSFENDALELLVEKSDNYPFFIQIIGYDLWEIVFNNSVKVIDLQMAENVIKTSSNQRTEFYIERFNEIVKLKNEKIMFEIVVYIRENHDEIDILKLKRYVNKKYGDENGFEAIQKLFELGIIWEQEELVRPGIPSFFDYILKRIENINNGE